MAMKCLVLNGPNLSRLDLREKSYYGDITYQDIEEAIKKEAATLQIDAEIRQSNDESEIISWLHEAADNKVPIIFNPAHLFVLLKIKSGVNFVDFFGYFRFFHY